jgi:hypothetical protein
MTSITAEARSGTWLLVVASLLLASIASGGCRDAKNDEKPGAPGATSAATPTGGHANEEFCKTLVAQFAALAKFDPSDVSKRQAYFAEQKEFNAKLLKTAPASLQSDTQLQVRNANAAYDAQIAGNVAAIKSTSAVLRTPENFAASAHMRDYCGIKVTATQ